MNIVKVIMNNLGIGKVKRIILDDYITSPANLLISEKETNNWIPTSERLPDVFKYVLVTSSSGGRTIAHRMPNQTNWYDLHSVPVETGVIAWHPLPDPYRPKTKIDYSNLIAGVIDATKITIISSGATCSNCAQAKGDIKKICDNKKSEEYTNFVADNMTCNNHQLKTEGADGHRR